MVIVTMPQWANKQSIMHEQNSTLLFMSPVSPVVHTEATEYLS